MLSSTQLYKISPEWQEHHVCPKASEVVIGLVSSHATGVTLQVWLEGDLALISARDLTMRDIRESKSLFPLLPLIEVLEGSHHTCMKEREKVYSFGFSPLSPFSLGNMLWKLMVFFWGRS